MGDFSKNQSRGVMGMKLDWRGLKNKGGVRIQSG